MTQRHRRISRAFACVPARRADHGPATSTRFVSDLLWRLRTHLEAKEQFCGAYDGTGEFACRDLPDDVQIATHVRAGAGAVLAEKAAGLCLAGQDAPHPGLVSVDTTVERIFATTPKSQTGADDCMIAQLRVGTLPLVMECGMRWSTRWSTGTRSGAPY